MLKYMQYTQSLSSTTGFSTTKEWVIGGNYKLKNYNTFSLTLTKVILIISLNTEFFATSEKH